MIRFDWVRRGDEWLATSVDAPDGVDGSAPAVIVVHGLAGHRIGNSHQLVHLGRRLSAAGVACVRFDQAGCGESTGASTDVTVQTMADDTRAVRDWLLQQPWVDPRRVAYVGSSLGALAAVAAEAERPAAGVALWAPIYDLPRIFSRTARTGLRAVLSERGWVPYEGLRLGVGFVDALGAIDPTRLLGRSSAPVGLYHSHLDDLVPFQESKAYRTTCAEVGRPCTLTEFTTADHGFSNDGDRVKLLSRTVDFLRKCLAAE